MENFVVFMEGVVFYTVEGIYPGIVNPLFDCVFLPRKKKNFTILHVYYYIMLFYIYIYFFFFFFRFLGPLS